LHDCNFSGEDCNLSGQDYNLSGEDCNLSGEDCNLSGEDCNLSGEDYNLSGEDCKLSGEDCNLSGEDCNLGEQDCNLRGQNCKLDLRERHLRQSAHTQEEGTMALWSTGLMWSSLPPTLWGPTAKPTGSRNKNRKSRLHTMKRDNFYPRRKALRPEWHTNLAAKLLIHGPTLTLTAAVINNGVADNLTLAYGLGDWKTNLYEAGPSGTAALADLETGTSGELFVFPTYSAPTPPILPVGADPVRAGALDRTFLLIKEIKAKATYTLAIGLDMGIVGPEAPPPPPGEAPPPRIKVTVIQGEGHQNGQIKFFKDGHTGVWVETRRGNGDWEFLTTSDKSPIIDDRPLLVAGQAEVREIRARFWDQGKPNGAWCDVAKVTIGP